MEVHVFALPFIDLRRDKSYFDRDRTTLLTMDNTPLVHAGSPNACNAISFVIPIALQRNLMVVVISSSRTLANNAEPDQTLQNAAFDPGLYCLH